MYLVLSRIGEKNTSTFPRLVSRSGHAFDTETHVLRVKAPLPQTVNLSQPEVTLRRIKDIAFYAIAASKSPVPFCGGEHLASLPRLVRGREWRCWGIDG